jgi:8-oxo-dGTP pyrophosphatase MutT (NUDIX family)
MPTQNGPWIIHTSTLIHKDGFIEVSEDHITRPSGSPGKYTTITMKPGVSVLPVDADGTVTLIRQFRYALRRERLECVCGGIDGTESPEEAARRELKEEAGIDARRLMPLGTVEMDGSIILNCNHLFIARDLHHVEPDREATELIEPVSMPLAEAVNKVLSGEIDHAPTCVLILKAAQSPTLFSAEDYHPQTGC